MAEFHAAKITDRRQTLINRLKIGNIDIIIRLILQGNDQVRRYLQYITHFFCYWNNMKRIGTLALLLMSCMLASAQSGYKIPITLKPYKNTQVYLGYYYGKVKALADSVLLDADSKGEFE